MVCPHLKKPKLQYILYAGVFFLLLGIILVFIWPAIFTHVINQNMGISPTSKYFNFWKRSQKPAIMEVYLFNWTNPEDGHNETVKPKFVEVGPFRFLEYKEKFDYTFNSNNTLSFRQKKIWFFDEENSPHSLDMKITTLNAVLVTISHKTKDFSPFLKIPISLSLRALSPKLHVTKPVRELLFDGYVDDLLATLKGFGASELPEGGRFGFLQGKNDSSRDGFYNMDISPASKGLIRRWNYETETSYFKSRCAKVHGTTAEMYPPGRSRDTVTFFSGDMCRQLQLDYEKDVSFFGLPTYKYVADKSLLDNGTLVKENACYCNGECMPSGVMNVSACRQGSPFFISMPHFLKADPFYLQGIEGLKPDPEKHQFYQIVEPATGIVVEANIRIQMNFYLKPVDSMPIISDVPKVMFPILWFQMQSKGTPEVASRINNVLNLPTILQSIAYVLIAVSVLMIVVGLYARKKDKIHPPTLTNSVLESVPLKKSDFDGKVPN